MGVGLERVFQEAETVQTKALSRDDIPVCMWSSLCLDFEVHKELYDEQKPTSIYRRIRYKILHFDFQNKWHTCRMTGNLDANWGFLFGYKFYGKNVWCARWKWASRQTSTHCSKNIHIRLKLQQNSVRVQKTYSLTMTLYYSTDDALYPIVGAIQKKKIDKVILPKQISPGFGGSMCGTSKEVVKASPEEKKVNQRHYCILKYLKNFHLEERVDVFFVSSQCRTRNSGQAHFHSK